MTGDCHARELDHENVNRVGEVISGWVRKGRWSLGGRREHGDGLLIQIEDERMGVLGRIGN